MIIHATNLCSNRADLGMCSSSTSLASNLFGLEAQFEHLHEYPSSETDASPLVAAAATTGTASEYARPGMY